MTIISRWINARIGYKRCPLLMSHIAAKRITFKGTTNLYMRNPKQKTKVLFVYV